MMWSEVKKLYPYQFVKFEIVESHEDDKYRYVDDVEVIKVIKNGNKAMKEFIKCKNGQLVYSTANEEIVIEKVKNIRVRMQI